MISHDRSHDRHGKEVHRPCSNCISSIENLTGTLLSSLGQLLNKRAVGFIPAWSLAFLYFGAVKTMEIVEELIEIGSNKICDNKII